MIKDKKWDKFFPEITLKLKQKFAIYRVYRWSGYVDDKREENVVRIFENAAKLNSLVPSYLCTIAVGEGRAKGYFKI